MGRGGGGSGLIENNANSVCKIELIPEKNLNDWVGVVGVKIPIYFGNC